MRARRWATTLVTAVLGVAVLGACGTRADGGDASRAEEPGATAAARPSSPATPQDGAAHAAADDDAADDAAACTAFGDVLTIVENADVALAEGRMAAQEQHGWYQLATRVLDRLPSGGGTAVQTAVGALQEAAPAVPSGASAESTGVCSPAWSAAEVDLAAACEEIGSPRSEEHTS